jgi:heme A synthase
VFYAAVAALSVGSAVTSRDDAAGNVAFYAALGGWAAWGARVRVRDLRLPKRYLLFLATLALFGALAVTSTAGWPRMVTAVCTAGLLVAYLAGTELYVRSRRTQVLHRVTRGQTVRWALAAGAITALLLLLGANSSTASAHPAAPAGTRPTPSGTPRGATA